jgi:NADPH:quinone reductase-like Zn-dependent oxidoreductase
VEAAGVNFADLMMRAGLYGTVPPMPYSPGFEVAGVIARTGPGVAGFHEGDRVVALIRYGGYARDLIVPTRNIFRYPGVLTPVEAAAVPVVFLTAHVALFTTAHAAPGETALILGAAGGVGTAAVQLAHEAGLKVIGTAGTDAKRGFVCRQLGASACFDSRGDWEPAVLDAVGRRGIDVALDPVGGRATRSCLRLLAPFGRLVFYGLSTAMPHQRREWVQAARAWLGTPRIHPLSLIEPNIGVFGIHLLHLQRKEEVLRPAMESIYHRIAAGTLRPIIDRTFSLTRDGAVAAHHHLHSRAATGKIVLVA